MATESGSYGYAGSRWVSGERIETEPVDMAGHPGLNSGIELCRSMGGRFARVIGEQMAPATVIICRTDDATDGDTFLAAYVQRAGWVPGWYCAPTAEDLILCRDSALRDLSNCQHATRETLEAELAAGRTPCGDDAEDGSGRGSCYAQDGACASYSYITVDGGYVVTAYGIE